MAATPTPEPPVGAIRSGIEASVWRAVDNGTADIYMGVDFSSLPDGELVLIAARACAELERNANDYRDGAA